MNRKYRLSIRYQYPDRNRGAEDGVFAGIVNVLREQHDHQLPVATKHQILFRKVDGQFHVRQSIFKAGQHLFNE